MNATRRIRLELDEPTYETLRYFALLRGVPMGHAIRRLLALHAEQVRKDFPAVQAHVMAWQETINAKQALAHPDPDDLPY